jgi:hypothetical protein
MQYWQLKLRCAPEALCVCVHTKHQLHNSTDIASVSRMVLTAYSSTTASTAATATVTWLHC